MNEVIRDALIAFLVFLMLFSRTSHKLLGNAGKGIMIFLLIIGITWLNNKFHLSPVQIPFKIIWYNPITYIPASKEIIMAYYQAYHAFDFIMALLIGIYMACAVYFILLRKPLEEVDAEAATIKE